MSKSGKFLYFAFGSNLLAERIHIMNPSAVFKSVGKVKGYKLDFGYFSQRYVLTYLTLMTRVIY
jgi:gamma-glutamylcyclotransferase